jgi:nitrile hydratase accessory protein
MTGRATIATLNDIIREPNEASVASASFSEPWQAQLFAVTLQLSRQGAFTWAQWVEVFSSEIAAHPQGETESVEDAYFRQWFAALEQMLLQLGIEPDDISDTQLHWKRSYLATPHGQPVVLDRCLPGLELDSELDHHDHHHHGHGQKEPRPIAISPGTRFG